MNSGGDIGSSAGGMEQVRPSVNRGRLLSPVTNSRGIFHRFQPTCVHGGLSMCIGLAGDPSRLIAISLGGPLVTDQAEPRESVSRRIRTNERLRARRFGSRLTAAPAAPIAPALPARRFTELRNDNSGRTSVRS